MRGTAFYCYSTQPSIDAFVAFLNNQPVRFFFAFDRTHYGYWFFFFHGLTCSTGGFLIFKTEHDGRLKVCGTLVSVGCYYLRCWRGHVEQQWAESRSTRLFFFLSLCLFVFPGIIKPQFHRLFPASFTCHYHAHYGPPSRYLHLNFVTRLLSFLPGSLSLLNWRIVFFSLTEGDHDSGVDESTQAKVKTPDP